MESLKLKHCWLCKARKPKVLVATPTGERDKVFCNATKEKIFCSKNCAANWALLFVEGDAGEELERQSAKDNT